MKNSKAKQHNLKRRDFVQLSTAGLLASALNVKGVLAGQDGTRQGAARVSPLYTNAQAYATELKSNQKALQTFRQKLDKFEARLKAGGTLESAASELTSADSRLKRLQQQHAEQGPQAIIIIIIIIIILVAIPKDAK